MLPAGAKELKVPMTWTDGQGLTVTKTFVFKRGWYSIDLSYEVDNDRPAARAPRLLRADPAALGARVALVFRRRDLFVQGPGVVRWSKSRDLKVESEADSKFSETVTNGWLASLQHHFVSAIVPPADQAYDYQLQVQGHEYLLSATGPFKQIAAGASAEFHEKLFVGPKLQSQLAVDRSSPRAHGRLRHV